MLPDATPEEALGLLLAGLPGPLPAFCTAAELARLRSCSERWIASQKAAGTIPVSAAGRIDLRAIVAAGVARLGGAELVADLAVRAMQAQPARTAP